MKYLRAGPTWFTVTTVVLPHKAFVVTTKLQCISQHVLHLGIVGNQSAAFTEGHLLTLENQEVLARPKQVFIKLMILRQLLMFVSLCLSGNSPQITRALCYTAAQADFNKINAFFSRLPQQTRNPQRKVTRASALCFTQVFAQVIVWDGEVFGGSTLLGRGDCLH